MDWLRRALLPSLGAVRSLIGASKATAVHSRPLAERLASDIPSAPVEHIRLGHGTVIDDETAAGGRRRVRERYHIPDEAVVFGVVGGISREKRIPQALDAFRAVHAHHPTARLILVGATADHYDLASDLAIRGSAGVITTGYVPDDELAAHMAAVDVSINLRWPSAREISGPWLHAIAAGRATITTDLWHTADVPSLDPRTWTVNHLAPRQADAPEPVTVAIDILDEAHSLGVAMRRLAADADLRTRLGRAAHAHWSRHHTRAAMADDYRRTIARAIAAPEPDTTTLPAHLKTRGDEWLTRLLEPFGLQQNPWSRI